MALVVSIYDAMSKNTLKYLRDYMEIALGIVQSDKPSADKIVSSFPLTE
jgi:hypothetical protein